MVVCRSFWQGRQIGHFFQRQLVERFIEIIQGRCSHAIAAKAKIDFVQIKRENLIFRKGPFHAKRQNGFLDLAIN